MTHPANVSTLGTNALSQPLPEGWVLYFGYGSNLNKADLAEWCRRRRFAPETMFNQMRSLGPAVLPDHALVFNHYSSTRHGGVLNVVPARGVMTEGVVFAVGPDAMELIRQKEGAPSMHLRNPGGYEAMSKVIIDPTTGCEISAFTFAVASTPATSFIAPEQAYLDVCRAGREQHSLSQRSLHYASLNSRNAHFESPLFIYGTLLGGESRAQLVADATLPHRAVAVARGALYDHGDWPALVPHHSGRVLGEVVVPTDPASFYSILDRIEGHLGFGAPPRLFRRTVLRMGIEGEPVGDLAWAYVLDKAAGTAARIACGSWRHRALQNAAGEPAGSHLVPTVFAIQQEECVAAGSEDELVRKLVERRFIHMEDPARYFLERIRAGAYRVIL